MSLRTSTEQLKREIAQLEAKMARRNIMTFAIRVYNDPEDDPELEALREPDSVRTIEVGGMVQREPHAG
jgi:hypothetical protein